MAKEKEAADKKFSKNDLLGKQEQSEPADMEPEEPTTEELEDEVNEPEEDEDQ